MPTRRCSQCGSNAPAGSRFCPRCGAPLVGGSATARQSPAATQFRIRAGALRDRGRGIVEILRTGAGIRARMARLRAERERLLHDRRELLAAFGDAVYRGDTEATSSARTALERLDREIADKEAEMEWTTTAGRARVERTRLETDPTMIVASEPFPPPGEATPPEPARVPEPYPPPGEADPPQPAVVPEPYPDPGEADPPEPARIPEPGPQEGSR